MSSTLTDTLSVLYAGVCCFRDPGLFQNLAVLFGLLGSVWIIVDAAFRLSGSSFPPWFP